MGVRQEAWDQVASGERPVVVGARSALFAPVPDLGLIVIDEEHDPSYKQDIDPRYDARAVASALADRRRAVVLLGSATPRTETLWMAHLAHTTSTGCASGRSRLPPTCRPCRLSICAWSCNPVTRH